MRYIIWAIASVSALATAACGQVPARSEAPPANEAAPAPTPSAAPAPAPTTTQAARTDRGVVDPHAFVVSRYAAYTANDGSVPDWPTFAYSDRLKALFDAYDAWSSAHEDLVGSLDFDWWSNAQDWELGNVIVTERIEGPDRRTETARFTNGGRPEEVRFLFVRNGERWFLDDAVQGSGRGDDGWTLSALLRERAE